MNIREQMARAIAAANMEPFAHIEWELYLPEADAALSILTNPSNELVKRCAKAACKAGGYGDYAIASSLYDELARAVLVAVGEG